MSGLIQPVGPEGPKVYWLRRALLLGAVISTFILIYNQLSSPAQPTAASSTDTPIPTQTSELTNQNSASPQTSPSVTATESVTAISNCTDDQISVSVSIDPQNPKVNQSLKLTMSVTNTSTTTCQRDVGSGVDEITIISGPALIWSTDHCNPSTATDLRTLEPNQKISVTATWNGTQTSKGCVKHNQATAGTYWAHARNASKNSDGVRFVISD